MKEDSFHDLGISTVDFYVVGMVSVIVGSMGMAVGTVVGMTVTAAATVGVSVAVLEGVDSHEID